MITLKKIPTPNLETGLEPVMLSDETMQERKNQLIQKMKKDNYDALVIYADLEHGSNFEYLAGFLPRFEEALFILNSDGKAYMVLGNENLNKAAHSRNPVTPIHMPYFSLPNQPMKTKKTVAEILKESGIHQAKSIGLVGWKNFTSSHDNNAALYDLPYFVVEALKEICQESKFSNAAYLFIGVDGVRTTNNANEVAHYEFGGALAGKCLLETLKDLKIGISEMELAGKLNAYGQKNSVVTIMATGKRFEKANLYPGVKTIQKGDPISISIGYKGGLQSRGGYAITCKEELLAEQQDYLARVAIPYFNAVTTWLESIKIGMSGKELYDNIENVLPKAKYGWSLNPGHLCADEEWMSSPIYPESKEILKSGMLFQIDIIPSVPGYSGISCESGIILADEILRNEIQKEYPEMWKRMQKRRQYMIKELGILLPEEVLPTSSATAYCTPFFLDKQSALVKEGQ